MQGRGFKGEEGLRGRGAASLLPIRAAPRSSQCVPSPLRGPAAPPAGQPHSTRAPWAGSPGWRANSESFSRPFRS
ncbi:hypothetical protein NDU88_003199 [Pleurodeles waltl]|uniref:Uncharacterized protein n=1 Tax=Pleurodeles waltl TaxID=8319 RepID=A0AAV7MPW5_PLEWA|nr:hypothetical protein NDU88_003199 [Pleurodeles waltl]